MIFLINKISTKDKKTCINLYETDTCDKINQNHVGLIEVGPRVETQRGREQREMQRSSFKEKVLLIPAGISRNKARDRNKICKKP